ncbi:MAG TPA: cytochrome c3 family protein [Myxococcales bacterium]|jgi:predicted CXXCH cytochrome family protein
MTKPAVCLAVFTAASLLAAAALAAGADPVVDSLVGSEPETFPDSKVHLTVVAHDPSSLPLTFSWSATGGTLSGTTGTEVDWASGATGGFTLTVIADNGVGGTASASLALVVSLAKAGNPWVPPNGSPFAPRRIALDPSGAAYVSDASASRVVVFSKLGKWMRTLAVPGKPAGLAAAPGGRLLVGDVAGRQVVKVDLSTGKVTGALGAGPGELSRPVAIVAADSGEVFVADADARAVMAYSAGGALAQRLDIQGQPVGLARDAASGKLFVANANTGAIEVYTAALQRAGTVGSFGAAAGQLARASGIALGARLYAVDAFQGAITAFDLSGGYLGTLGTEGRGRGQLAIPTDVAVDASGRLLVANSDAARVEVFEPQGFVAPSCGGDSDCDGLPDAWELAAGLNPNDPSDAWADSDGDGLTDQREYALGTDPRKTDTDGDGVSDFAEVEAGQDPRDPKDNLPVAVARAPALSEPTRLSLDGTRSSDPNGLALTYSWRQVSGPSTVQVAGAQTAAPTFVARVAGEYVFGLKVSNGRATSLESTANTVLSNVAPAAWAGVDLGGTVGVPVVLDGRFSSDGNGDAIAFAWKQVGGPAVALAGADTARPGFTPSRAGIYTFELVASDAEAQGIASRVYVSIDAAGDHVPVAAVLETPEAQVGQKVTISGLPSVDTDGDELTYAWTQVAGVQQTLSGAERPEASFVPTVEGVYRFELSVSDGKRWSRPATATVVVSSADVQTPLAEAGFDQRGSVLTSVTLNGTGSRVQAGQATRYRWSQVQGPWAPLSDEGAKASFLPLDAGTYVYELEVWGSGEGTRDRVTIVVDGPAEKVPAAKVAASARPGGEVRLTGSADVWATGFAWTQMAGPHVILADPHSLVTSFLPPIPGTYAFELRADDGTALSPPAVATWSAGAPVAVAGGDRLVRPGAAALDGSMSVSPNGTPLSMRWKQTGGPAATLTGADGSTLQLSPDLSGFTLRFSLTVSDGLLVSAPSEANLSVVDVPLALQELGPEGGRLRVAAAGSPFDGMTIDAPPGALDRPTSIAVGEVTRAWWKQAGRTPYRSALFLGPVGTQLLKPLELTLPLGAVAPDGLAIAAYDHDRGAWGQANAEIASKSTVAHVSTDRPAVFQMSVPEMEKPPVAPPGEAPQSCGCTATSGAGSMPAFGLLVSALLAIGLRRRRRGALLAAGLALGVGFVASPRPARATDAPHDFARLTNGCDDCHISHRAVGMGLTTKEGNANLCLSCHATMSVGHYDWKTGDQAVPGAGGVHHRWDAPADSAAHGAAAPTDMALYPHLESTTPKSIVCSTCHDQHMATKSGSMRASSVNKIASGGGSTSTNLSLTATVAATANPKVYLVEIVETGGAVGVAKYRISNDNGSSWWGWSGSAWAIYAANARATSGTATALNDGTNVSVAFAAANYAIGDRFDFYVAYPFLRSADESSALCLKCHGPWQMADSTTGADGVKVFSHPVGVGLAKAYDRTGALLDANGAVQGSAGKDAINSNDLQLDTTNKVHCLSCHSPHAADSNSLTEDVR